MGALGRWLEEQHPGLILAKCTHWHWLIVNTLLQKKYVYRPRVKPLIVSMLREFLWFMVFGWWGSNQLLQYFIDGASTNVLLIFVWRSFIKWLANPSLIYEMVSLRLSFFLLHFFFKIIGIFWYWENKTKFQSRTISP